MDRRFFLKSLAAGAGVVAIAPATLVESAAPAPTRTTLTAREVVALHRDLADLETDEDMDRWLDRFELCDLNSQCLLAIASLWTLGAAQLITANVRFLRWATAHRDVFTEK